MTVAVAAGAALAAAAALAACGGSGDPESVVSDYIEATRDGDAAAACEAVAQSVPEAKYEEDCDPPDDSEVEAVEVADGDFEFETFEEGDRATVSVSPPDGSEGGDLLLIKEDGEWKIVGDFESIDADAKAQARTAQTAIETLATDQSGSYEGASTDQLVEIEATLGEAEIAVEDPTESGYTVTATSVTGATFSITREDTGETTYACEPTGTGGCPESGDWTE